MKVQKHNAKSDVDVDVYDDIEIFFFCLIWSTLKFPPSHASFDDYLDINY